MVLRTTIKLSQWYFARRSDGTYVVTGKADSKVFHDKEDWVELYTVISPKDMGDHYLFDLPGSFSVKCYKASKKKDKTHGSPLH